MSEAAGRPEGPVTPENEPTVALGRPEPTQPLPGSPWAPPGGTGQPAQAPTSAQPQPGSAASWPPPAGEPTGTWPPPTQPGYPGAAWPGPGYYPQPGYVQHPGHYQPQHGHQTGYYTQPGQQPSGPYPQPGQQPSAPYGQPGHQPLHYQPGYYHPGYQGQPGPQPGRYFYPPAQPTPPQRKHWPLALVAVVVAFVMTAASLTWLGRTLPGVLPSAGPQRTQPANPVPERTRTDQGTTTGRTISPGQSAGVVLIEALSSSGGGAGTGMILTPDGQVLTNYHVVAGSEKLRVTVADSGDTYPATVVGFDQSRDVALLQLKDAAGLATIRPDSDPVAVGDLVAAVGNADGGGELVKAGGQVTAVNQDLTVSSDSPWGNTEDLSGLIETNAKAVPGDSGGPMFDDQAEVLGMTTAGSIREGTSYAVPIRTALAVVDQIRTGQDAGTVRVGPAGYLGVLVAESDQATSGKTVTKVVSGSPADQAGMVAGSRLTRVGASAITSRTNLATVIRSLEPGQQVEIQWVTPKGETRTATVTLGSSPVN